MDGPSAHRKAGAIYVYRALDGLNCAGYGAVVLGGSHEPNRMLMVVLYTVICFAIYIHLGFSGLGLVRCFVGPA